MLLYTNIENIGSVKLQNLGGNYENQIWSCFINFYFCICWV